MARQPRFYLVLGPSGAGKSTAFDGKLNVDSLNRDKLLQKYSPHGDTRWASRQARSLARHEENEFILNHLHHGKSFATERTFTFASEVKRVDDAKAAGFQTNVIFVAAGSADNHVRRANIRAKRGGHHVSDTEVREIYTRSMRNLPLLLEAAAEGRIDNLSVYDNSGEQHMTQLLDINNGRIRQANAKSPAWLTRALAGTSFNIPALRTAIQNHSHIGTLDTHGEIRRAALQAKLNPVDVLVTGQFARALGSERVLHDMQNAREDFVLGVSRDRIIAELHVSHHGQRGAKDYAETVMDAVEEQTGWTQPAKPRQHSPREITLRLTEKQVRLLLAEQHHGDKTKQQNALTDILSGNHPTPIFKGRAELSFSPKSGTIYAVLDKDDQADLEQHISKLQRRSRPRKPRTGIER